MNSKLFRARFVFAIVNQIAALVNRVFVNQIFLRRFFPGCGACSGCSPIISSFSPLCSSNTFCHV
ncbi:MAG: hypothetical protein H0W58_02225 [Acidobacteria bacterium]|nr:hypothetical protein [Acidobacteriota bacterium]